MNLEQSRKTIDEIDSQLTKLFAERMSCAAEIAAYKKENNLPVLDAGRERQKLAAIDPETVGQASRIPGVSPSDVSILLLLLGR